MSTQPNSVVNQLGFMNVPQFSIVSMKESDIA